MRSRGPTFDPDRICWFDTETGCKQDLKDVGAYRYACDPTAHVKILTYAIGRGPVKLHTAFAVGQPLSWFSLPEDFLRFADLAREDPRHKFAAHNAAFDRCMLNYAVDGAPDLPPEMFIDTMFQATASGLPPDLGAACLAAGAVQKYADGKKLVAMFCGHKAYATPQSHPAEWAQLCQYAITDVEAMRSLFFRTMQLPPQEWVEYWSQERINERGLAVDVEFARNADRLSQEAKRRAGEELARITGGLVTSVNGVKGIREYLLGILPDDGLKLMTKREEEEDDETGEVTRPAKYSLTRSRVEKLIPYCEEVQLHDAKRVLELRLYGGSAAPAKYGKIVRQQVDGFVYGQYVPGGAAMTGRASSRGIQIQNLVRRFLPYEHEAIEHILAGADYDSFAALGDDTPVMRKLALLIRTVFVPSQSFNLFVGSDLGQIEARIGRWLPGTPEADAALQVMRDCDADPSLPDIYVRAASSISNLPIDEIDEDTRQRGKIAELALLFGGSVGALQAMATGYGLYIADSEAKETVQRWRGANQWCVRFWGKHDEEQSYGLWGAALRALENPGKEQTAGRIRYIYLKDYLRGSLLCRLPSGRHLTYRGIKFEMVDELDDDDNVIGRSRQLRFWKGRQRSKIWHGTLMENCVQAVAADVLRGILVRLEEEGFEARLQSHDEVLVESHETLAADMSAELRKVMRQPFEWSDGLPLMSDEKVMPYYSKWKAKK
jgi:DNA polymerase